jgi:hypothetical protein
MMYRLTKVRGDGDNFLRFAVFPIRDTDFVEIKYLFGYTALYGLVQILSYFPDNTPGICERWLSCAPLRVCIASSESPRMREFTRHRVNVISN